VKIAKKSDKNYFPTNNNLLVAGRRCKADVVADTTLFKQRKQGNGKAQKTFRGNFPKNSILSTFRAFALSRINVLLTLQYIN